MTFSAPMSNFSTFQVLKNEKSNFRTFQDFSGPDYKQTGTYKPTMASHCIVTVQIYFYTITNI